MAGIYKSAAGRQAVETLYRRLLERWPVANRQVVIPTCQGETFVVVSGESHAVPIGLLHGSGTNASAWLRDVEAWSAHFRVYAVDT